MLNALLTAPPPYQAGPSSSQIPVTGPPLTQSQYGATISDEFVSYIFGGQTSDVGPSSQVYALTHFSPVATQYEDEDESTPCLARDRARREPNPPNKYTPSDPVSLL